jgi:hypothetical protein
MFPVVPKSPYATDRISLSTRMEQWGTKRKKHDMLVIFSTLKLSIQGTRRCDFTVTKLHFLAPKSLKRPRRGQNCAAELPSPLGPSQAAVVQTRMS